MTQPDGKTSTKCYRSLLLIVVISSLVVIIYFTSSAEPAPEFPTDDFDKFLEELDSIAAVDQQEPASANPPEEGQKITDDSPSQELDVIIVELSSSDNSSRIPDLEASQTSPVDAIQNVSVEPLGAPESPQKESPEGDSDNPNLPNDRDPNESQEEEEESALNLAKPIDVVEIVLTESEDHIEEQPMEPVSSTEHLPTNPPEQAANIPFILHQTAPTEMLPQGYKDLIQSCIDLNPDWQYILWRDQDKREFLRVFYPLQMDWLLAIPRDQQDQLFRFFVLQNYGGLFLELDTECVQPLAPLLANTSLFVAEERPEMAGIMRDAARSPDATSIAGAPGHRLFTALLELLSETVQSEEAVDVNLLLAAALESLEGWNCTLRDYGYFGAALNASLPWQDRCRIVLGKEESGQSDCLSKGLGHLYPLAVSSDL